jgi:hypothetical protein
MTQYNQIFDPQFSNIVETDTGANMPFPVWDDVQNSSVQVGETTQSNEVDSAKRPRVSCCVFVIPVYACLIIPCAVAFQPGQ